jgi:hypothetical protein
MVLFTGRGDWCAAGDRSMPAFAERGSLQNWSQENCFEYLREEYALDALVEHAIEKDEPTREAPNPRSKLLVAEIRGRSRKEELSSKRLRARLRTST